MLPLAVFIGPLPVERPQMPETDKPACAAPFNPPQAPPLKLYITVPLLKSTIRSTLPWVPPTSPRDPLIAADVPVGRIAHTLRRITWSGFPPFESSPPGGVGPGAFGPGAFGPGAFGPGAFGPGAFGPGGVVPPPPTGSWLPVSSFPPPEAAVPVARTRRCSTLRSPNQITRCDPSARYVVRLWGQQPDDAVWATIRPADPEHAGRGAGS